MKVTKTLIILFAVFLYSCDENTPLEQESPDLRPLTSDSDLLGSWLLYETGYSPGAGYIIKKIPSTPAQLIQFKGDQTFFSNIRGYTDYKFYGVLEHPTYKSKIVAFFKSKPAPVVDINQLEAWNYVNFKGSNLALSNPRCIEGCHVGFRPLLKIK